MSKFQVPSKYFVYYEGDIEKDPLDYGVRMFDYGIEASQFKKRMENSGMTTTVYFGQVSGMFHPDIGKHGDECKCERCKE